MSTPFHNYIVPLFFFFFVLRLSDRAEQFTNGDTTLWRTCSHKNIHIITEHYTYSCSTGINYFQRVIINSAMKFSFVP